MLLERPDPENTGGERDERQQERAGDDEGDVEFIARGKTGGKEFAHHERSRFRRVDGRWFYMDDKGKGLELGAWVVECVRDAAGVTISL